MPGEQGGAEQEGRLQKRHLQQEIQPTYCSLENCAGENIRFIIYLIPIMKIKVTKTTRNHMFLGGVIPRRRKASSYSLFSALSRITLPATIGIRCGSGFSSTLTLR